MKEALLMKELHHPYIIPFIACGRFNLHTRSQVCV
jgi:hypothetical protein